MSAGNTFETELPEHILNNADIALIGDAAGLPGSAADGNLYVSLPLTAGAAVHGTVASGAGVAPSAIAAARAVWSPLTDEWMLKLADIWSTRRGHAQVMMPLPLVSARATWETCTEAELLELAAAIAVVRKTEKRARDGDYNSF